MTEDQVNKVETIIGYLEYFIKQRGDLRNSADEIEGCVLEAKLWIAEERMNLINQLRGGK